ncbi:hypothetical protein PG987_007074 [Apiospora arundinis]
MGPGAAWSVMMPRIMRFVLAMMSSEMNDMDDAFDGFFVGLGVGDVQHLYERKTIDTDMLQLVPEQWLPPRVTARGWDMFLERLLPTFPFNADCIAAPNLNQPKLENKEHA